MQTLIRGESSDCAHPALTVFTPVDGILGDVDALAYVILDRTGPAPVQVFPAAGRAAVEVHADCPAGHRLGPGHYLAVYTPPAAANVGRYAVRWFLETGPGRTWAFETPFEVLAAPVEPPRPGYCFLQDLRDEGFGPEIVSDGRLARLIAFASRYIESTTERFFEPRYQRIEVSGHGAREILLGAPIIALEQLALAGDPDPQRPGAALDRSSCRIYNRHITQGLLKPDDRDNPKLCPIAWQGLGFSAGMHHVRVTGLFGYTDPDGSPTGETPQLIREACKRLVAREIPLLSETGKREDAQRRHRLIQEKTRDQSYTLDRLHLHGMLTGDPEIDSLLIQFKRPVDLGAA